MRFVFKKIVVRFGSIVLILVLYFAVSGAFTPVEAELYLDNFDSYSTGNLFSQSDWYSINQNVGTVSDILSLSAPNSFVVGSQFSSDYAGYQIGANTEGRVEAYIYVYTVSGSGSGQAVGISNYYVFNVSDGGKVDIRENGDVWLSASGMSGGSVLIDTLTETGWIKVELWWSGAGTFLTMKGCVDEVCTTYQTFNAPEQTKNITAVGIFTHTNGNGNWYLDDFAYYTDASLSTEPSIWGITPESGTEITNLDQTLTVGYINLNDYDSVYISFKHPQTGIFTEAIQFDTSVIGDNGELELDISDFNIDKNGGWFLHAVATYEGYQYEDEYFLSGYGWNWTGDITDGEYYLDINIAGYEEMFVMSGFQNWYFSVSKFATPTDMFVSIVGFFEPTFNRIGEFGNRLADYFNVAESYAQGYEIGRTIPYFTYFVGQISLLLGGFPVLMWLVITILILVGFFIFRLVLKFIPFLGGS